MRELDGNKAYDLSKINETELQEVINWLNKNKLDSQVNLCKNEFIKGKISDGRYLHYYKDVDGDLLWGFRKTNKEPIDAKELFYTLENIQVDCSNETEGRIKQMADVYINNGYTYTNDIDFALRVNANNFHLQALADKEVCVYSSDPGCTTITYEKFMELFNNKEEFKLNLESNPLNGNLFCKELEKYSWNKEENFKKLVEVLNEELTEKAYKETEYEVKYIAEKPKQYQIGIDTFERCESNMTKEEILACVKFGIDKYTWRNKGQDLEDLEKIISYANWGIKQLKK